MMFVPGSRPGWIDKANGAGADALVYDLEDSVPQGAKAEARGVVAAAIERFDPATAALYVRTNKGSYIYDFDDLLAVVHAKVSGIFVAKAEGPEDLDLLDRLVSEVEDRKGLSVGQTRFVVALETARAAELVFPIASHPRVQTIVASAAKNADVARALGFTWTPEGLETLYFRSRAVIACRAAGKRFPIGGLWQEVHDLDGLRRAAEFNRRLGFRGEIVLHPSNVPVVNEIYSLSDADRAYYQAMITAFAEAEAKGLASVIYEGEHIDIAHVVTARELLADAADAKAGA
jgi:citrate lyase subunit beta/citryl-CoA lyase